MPVYKTMPKLCRHHRLPALTSFNKQWMLLTSMMIAHKFPDEPVSPNAQWALFGDISVKELTRLELKMFWALRFRSRSRMPSISTAEPPWRQLTKARARAGQQRLRRAALRPRPQLVFRLIPGLRCVHILDIPFLAGGCVHVKTRTL